MNGVMKPLGYIELVMIIGAIPFGFGIHGIYKIQTDMEGFYSEEQSKYFAFHWKLGFLLTLIGILIIVVLGY